MLRKKKVILCILPALLILYLCFFPIPIRIRTSFEAQRYSAQNSSKPIPCTVSIDGMYSLYLFRGDVYKGALEISDVPETAADNAYLRTPFHNNLGHLWYQTEDEILDLGYWVAPRSFDWLYIRLDNPDGTYAEIIGPANADWSEMKDTVARILNHPIQAVP